MIVDIEMPFFGLVKSQLVPCPTLGISFLGHVLPFGVDVFMPLVIDISIPTRVSVSLPSSIFLYLFEGFSLACSSFMSLSVFTFWPTL